MLKLLMRLVNSRFAIENKFFWDERASSLENQTTQPIQNHIEMGFSGANGDAGISTLITKLQNIEYYKELFKFTYGSEEITETKNLVMLNMLKQNSASERIKAVSYAYEMEDADKVTIKMIPIWILLRCNNLQLFFIEIYSIYNSINTRILLLDTLT